MASLGIFGIYGDESSSKFVCTAITSWLIIVIKVKICQFNFLACTCGHYGSICGQRCVVRHCKLDSNYDVIRGQCGCATGYQGTGCIKDNSQHITLLFTNISNSVIRPLLKGCLTRVTRIKAHGKLSRGFAVGCGGHF